MTVGHIKQAGHDKMHWESEGGFLSFGERLNRLRFFLWNIIPNIIDKVLWQATSVEPDPDIDMAMLVITIPLTAFYITTVVRRLHDLGKSGWAFCYTSGPMLLGLSMVLGNPVPGTLIAVTGVILVVWGIIGHLYLQFAKGQPGENEYGPDPLDRTISRSKSGFFGPTGLVDTLKAIGVATLLAASSYVVAFATGIKTIGDTPARDLLAERLSKEVDSENVGLPKKVDENTTFTSIKSQGRKVVYHFDITGYTPEDLKNGLPAMKANTIRDMCGDDDIKDMIRKGVTMSWEYTISGDTQGYTLTQSDCG